jgi:hypothetical protein
VSCSSTSKVDSASRGHLPCFGAPAPSAHKGYQDRNRLVAVYRALGGGWQIREDSYFVDAATAAQMRARTNWGVLLPPANAPQPPAPGLPGPESIGPTIRPPAW